MSRGERIRVRGLVQGVGFRPTVWRLARDCGLRGAVWNDAEGVVIEAWGPDQALERLVRALREAPPPLARIDAVERLPLTGRPPAGAFRIVASRAGTVHTGVVPDAATCPACLAEVMDPANRRHRYPFTNCTHCGPRLSIVRAIPYDRANTTMAAFPLCGQCLAEYRDPADRRFHAQPNACPACGPRVWLEDGRGRELPLDGALDAVQAAARRLAAGAILAVKGLGGFHLAVDASDAAAVDRLRARKHRYHKAFALMARDLDVVRRYARVGEEEARLLASPAAPIVVLDARSPPGGAPALAQGVAPGQTTLGFMLPYTPLHHLLLQDLDRPLVMTSGNRSDEPQCTGNRQARERLAGIADAFLMHDRDIANRVDDSVVRVVDGAPALLRRARGHAPAPIPLPAGFATAPPVLALGGELKNTFCLLGDGQAVVSQHMGDLEDAATFADLKRNLDLYRALFQHTPAAIAVDAHPEYLSAKWGRELAEADDLPLEVVLHHHAHVAACLAEHGRPLDAPPVLGIALDGLGYGPGGTLWGGEVLLADYRRCEHLAGLAPVPLLGGAMAMREPWRNAFAHLEAALGWERVAAAHADLDLVRFLAAKPVPTLLGMLRNGVNAPPASSAGRLFDAVAAAVGIRRERAGYEGQAAMELEANVTREALTAAGAGYPFDLERPVHGPWRVGYGAFWEALLADLHAGVPRAPVAARFHAGLASALADLTLDLAGRHGVDTVALGGGVLQNRRLLESLSGKLRAAGLTVQVPRRLPANDGGIALGQAAVAAARALAERR